MTASLTTAQGVTLVAHRVASDPDGFQTFTIRRDHRETVGVCSWVPDALMFELAGEQFPTLHDVLGAVAASMPPPATFAADDIGAFARKIEEAAAPQVALWYES